MKGSTLLVLFLLSFTSAFAQMPWTFVNTGANHTILVQSGTATIDGNPIEIGDYIGVFFDDAGTLVCGGYAQWTGSASNAVTAWGDDTSTRNKDGFSSGEVFDDTVQIAVVILIW